MHTFDGFIQRYLSKYMYIVNQKNIFRKICTNKLSTQWKYFIFKLAVIKCNKYIKRC